MAQEANQNRRGFHGPCRINEPESTDASRPTSMSRNVGIGSEMPVGLHTGRPMNADPHITGVDRGPLEPLRVAPSGSRSPNEMPEGLLRANGALNPDPHPYNVSSSVKQKNTYGAVPIEKRR